MSSSLEKGSLEPLMPSDVPSIREKRDFSLVVKVFNYLLAGVMIHCLLGLSQLFNLGLGFQSASPNLTPESLTTCAWNPLEQHVSLLSAPPIPASEFLTRQSTLASSLRTLDIQAFIAEPSASTAYYTNVSSNYELSERPFLIIISADGSFSYLAPKFELGRIAGLEMVYDADKGKRVIEWKEEESPYSVLKRELRLEKVMLDEHARFMIASGLQDAGVEVIGMSKEIQSLRAVKSVAELNILRAVNEFTLELVRALQGCIEVGVSQETIFEAANSLFKFAGIGEGYWAIVLFGEQAASPHGGSNGKVLEKGEFVLIDIGSSLHGYGSDVTRTILPPKSNVSEELLDVWYTVYESQGKAIKMMRPNETCSLVDKASRDVITEKGFGEFFTHRLGHGLGLEMHEHPFLNGANEEKLKAGEVVTNEPGIYVTQEQAGKLSMETGFGVRIEDAVLVTEEGGVVMTGERARSPWEP